MSEREKVESIVLISEPSQDSLDEGQLVAYESHRWKSLKWLARQGKNTHVQRSTHTRHTSPHRPSMRRWVLSLVGRSVSSEGFYAVLCDAELDPFDSCLDLNEGIIGKN